MTTPPWMLLRLGLDTRCYHAAADDDRLALMDVATRAEYRAFLARIYGFESVVERALLRVTDLEPQLVRDRCKADRLHDDLLALGMTPEVIGWLPAATGIHVRAPAQALGWLYVLERATLLSGLVRRHVQRRLGAQVLGAVNYLSACSEGPGWRFRALGEELGRYARRYPPRSIVAAANEAFRAQRHWYHAFARQVSSPVAAVS